MKIAIIAANGKQGKALVQEAMKRGFDVTAIVRGENQSGAAQVIHKDVMSLTREDIKDFDVVINALGTWTPETLPLHKTAAEHLSKIFDGLDTRLLIVGGAGSLYTDGSLKTRLMDTPDFPAEYLPIASAMAEGLDVYRKANGVRWTYVSPAADFDPEGSRTGKYESAGEVFTPNAKGESTISYADYAIAMLDEAEKGNHIQTRISVYQP